MIMTLTTRYQLFSDSYVAQPSPQPQNPKPELLFRKNKPGLCLTLQAALAVWTIILRFMGDLPEPVVYARNSLSGSGVKWQLHDKLGKDTGTQGPQHSRAAQVRGKGSRQMPTREGPRKLGGRVIR